jgi:hypothetical protein
MKDEVRDLVGRGTSFVVDWIAMCALVQTMIDLLLKHSSHEMAALPSPSLPSQARSLAAVRKALESAIVWL